MPINLDLGDVRFIKIEKPKNAILTISGVMTGSHAMLPCSQLHGSASPTTRAINPERLPSHSLIPSAIKRIAIMDTNCEKALNEILLEPNIIAHALRG